MPHLHELNLDGLPGPTHGFGGLSHGNLASTGNKDAISSPRAAALQGLDKMRLLMSLGVPQAVLPPHERPHLPTLRALGYAGSDAAVLSAAWKHEPDLLVAVSSASAMWTANAATVCPSADSADGRVHLTPANLAYQFHRSIEPAFTARTLRAVFPDTGPFSHHSPLPTHPTLGDEGAANHIRLGDAAPGYQLFVHGDSTSPQHSAPTRFPARQTHRASRAVARLNAVSQGRLLFLQQHPDAIDAGAFHNDVVSVGSADVLLMHERAFTLAPAEIAKLLPEGTHVLAATDAELTLDEAVSTYLFNSQLAALPSGELALIAPADVRDHPRARAVVDRFLSAGTRLRHVHYVDLRQSMRNGGGPACLRLRVPLTPAELSAVHPGVLLTPDLLARLTAWAHRHYRTDFRPPDLADPALLSETRTALDELTRLLHLGPLYDFQR